jgi:hypothetical protein
LSSVISVCGTEADGQLLREQVFDAMGVDRQPVEHAPDKWRGELDSLHIRYDGDPTPGHRARPVD